MLGITPINMINCKCIYENRQKVNEKMKALKITMWEWPEHVNRRESNLHTQSYRQGIIWIEVYRQTDMLLHSNTTNTR